MTSRDLVRSRRPDAIVTVYPDYLAPLGAVFTLAGQHVPLITVVTDLVTVHRMWFNDSSELCLVATQDAAIWLSGPVLRRQGQDHRYPGQS
ncbi:hypothetical protein [Candidatus Amarobacter glycogenicus]|uniref:MGDG synthase family glycosyltransferase n=1 Tax=Candidatus Amarobacter glycogenicus TaxID=3140699 RepID=UPI002A0FE1FC|nr:hypothetical protein [Dehalococcoidia bacterium]